MDTRRVPQARRLSVPAMHNPRFNQRTRFNTFRRKRQPITRTALKSLAPLNLDIPASSVTTPPLHTDPTPPHSLYWAVLSHLTDLEARLSSSSSALGLLHQLRDEVTAYFPSQEDTSEDVLEYDFEYDFGIRHALDFDFGSALYLDLDFDLRSRYAYLTAELSTLSLDEAKNKLYSLSTQSYDDAKSKFDSFKNRLVGEVRRWADGALPNIPTLPNMPDMHMPNISVPMAISDLHARLNELRAALPADLSSATDKLVSFVESLIEDDADGDVSWVDTRWKGLNIHPRGHEAQDDVVAGRKGKEREHKVDIYALALEKSQGGCQLIRYRDLPEKWKNNEFVWEGYRFIPGAKWATLVLSMFQLHNETINIQTHLIPLLVILSIIPLPWTSIFTQHPFLSNLPSISQFDIPSFDFTPLPYSPADPIPKFLFLLAAAACLTCSTIWHTLAGCSDLWLLEAGARIDYVGIGWLISASVSGVMYYGFACQPAIMRFYIGIAIMTGIAGSILPFQGWFNERRNKKWRIAFFLFCACSAVVPLGHLSYKHSFSRMWEFIGPVVPSLVSYLTGLAFYATHFPECCFPGWFDLAGSHAIWHVFIVIAIREHWKATAVFHETSHAFSCVAR